MGRPDGTPDGVYGEDSISMLRRAADCITAAGKPFGEWVLRSGTGMLTFWLELGARIIASGVDFGYILGGAADNLRAIRNLGVCRAAHLLNEKSLYCKRR